MKLEHLACYVKDLEGMKTFYMKYFNAIPNEKYHNSKTGLMGSTGRIGTCCTS